MILDTASFQFVAFGLVAAWVANFSRSVAWRSVVLMIANFVFLALLARSPLALVPLAGFLLLGYVGIVLLQRGQSGFFVWSILAVILAYVWLKKYSFLPADILLHQPYFTLGLSYIFFRVLHLLIEAGEGSEKRSIGLAAYLLYTLNFATLVSGPIQRYDEFARDQFADEPLPLEAGTVGLQLERIVLGFFKVNVLALVFDTVHADALTQLSQPVPISLKLLAAFQLAVAYPLFLYCNFSGYIDIVIALARLMRVRLPENFDCPFSASSFLDFWNRWHITLSAWLKTYVYNPLLMMLMRRITRPALAQYLGVLSFFVTFFLVGVWHGRTSEFVMFGVLQGGGVAANKLWQVMLTQSIGRRPYLALAANPFYASFGRGLTFTWFAFTLFWFWADWAQIHAIYRALGALPWLEVWTVLWLSATAVLAAWERLRAAVTSIPRSAAAIVTSRFARVMFATGLCVTSFVVAIVLDTPAPGIVYKAF